MMMHKLRRPVPSPNCNLLVTTGDMGVCLRACFCIVITLGSALRVTAVIQVEVVRVCMQCWCFSFLQANPVVCTVYV